MQILNRRRPALSVAVAATAAFGALAATGTPATAMESVTSPSVADGGTVTVSPREIQVSQRLGRSTSETVTLTNNGSRVVTVTIGEQTGSVDPMSAQPHRTGSTPVVQVPAAVTGHRLTDADADVDTADTRGAPDPAPLASPSDSAWTDIPDYPTAIMDNAVVATSGTLISVGGTDGARILDTVYAYDIDTQAWTPLTGMGVVREKPAAALIGDTVYVTGGWGTFGAPQASTQAYDIDTDTWTSVADNPNPYAGSGVAVLDQKMYVVGGCVDACGSTDVQVYDPASDTWSQVAPYPEKIAWESCGAIVGKLYCAGGLTPDGASGHTYVYDPVLDTWTQRADMPQALWASAYTSADGQLVVSGGSLGDSSITNAGYAYTPATDTWEPIANAQYAVYRGGSVCGLYKIGGSTGGFNPVPSSEYLAGYGACAADVPWLSESPATVSLDPGASADIRVTLDASVPTQPGTFHAGLSFATDTGVEVPAVPVTMTVNPPKKWGKIAGVVKGLSCDGTASPLSAATVTFDSWADTTSVRTGPDGTFGLWLDRRNSPVMVIATRDGWRAAYDTVRVRAGKTTTVQLTLRQYPHCR